VAGGGDGADARVTDSDVVAVPDGLVRELEARLGRCDDRGAEGGEFAAAGDVVVVDVGLEDMRDGGVPGGGGFAVGADVALRVDHSGDVAGDEQVGGVTEAVGNERDDIHVESV
jgi:hypothetical protein